VYSWHDPRLLSDESIYSYQDQGIQRFSYRLLPHSGDWRTAQPTRVAALLGQPVRAMLEAFHEGPLPASDSFVADGGGQVMITAVKGSEDPSDGPGGADLIVRAVETTGRAGTASLELPLVGRTIDVGFGASQIRTFRIPADPDAEIVEVDLVEWPLTDGTAQLTAEPDVSGDPRDVPAPAGDAVDPVETLTPVEQAETDPEGQLRGSEQ
jgi:alpha-mannosidase